MKSFTKLLSFVSRRCSKNDAITLADLTEYINDGHKLVCAAQEWKWLRRSYTIPTVAGQQAYTYPSYADKPMSVTVTVGTQVYSPVEITSRQQWDMVNSTPYVRSDMPDYWYVDGGEINLYPIPSSGGSSIKVHSKLQVKDLSRPDYSAGTILTATNNSQIISGSGTAWTGAMTGRWIRLTDSDTNNGGDGFWYEIKSVDSPTQITLIRKYGGTSITAGTVSYVLGQMPLIPEDFHLLPAYWAIAEYWDENDETRSKQYKQRYSDLMGLLTKEHLSPSSGVRLNVNSGRTLTNPNLYITSGVS